MNFVTHHNTAGVESKEIPCLLGVGAPTTTTAGAVGCLYMDELTGRMYKCTAVSGESYTWEEMVKIPTVPVQSVNGKTGAVSLSAADVKARPDNWMPTAQEVGALPDTYTPPNQTAEQVGADPKGTADTAVSQHNTSQNSHNDIRLALKAVNDRLTAFFDSDDATLDELSEIVAYITANKTLIEGITTGKVNVADIANDLTTNVANKPLSAAQGVVLKGLIDAVSNSLSDYALKSAIPTKVSQLTNDAGYLTQHQDISGKLDASELPTAINTALAQAAASGEFDGEDGRGIKSIVRTAGNGAAGTTDTYTITYTDNSTSTLTVYNGKNGTNGTSVTVKSVSESTEDGGSNIVTFSDGKTITIKNGSKGSKGDPGDDGKDYVLNEADKAEIVAMVIESLGGDPVFGYVDPDTMTIVFKNAPDGEYSLAYLKEDGTISAPIGSMVKDTNVYYSVTNTLTQCTTNNSATKAVEGESYSATITAKDGYKLSSVKVTMGGTDISSSAVSGGKITIAKVTGNIVITVVAVEDKPAYNNLADPSSSDWATDGRINSSGGVSSAAGCYVTNYIPCSYGDIIRVKGLDIRYNGTSGNANIGFYGASKNHLANGVTATMITNGVVTKDGELFIVPAATGASNTEVANTVYMRFAGGLMSGYTVNDVIITVNEPIA